ncbi:MAG: LytTR family transcriptional regulator [Bacteroidetes bacterium]|nr:LytTR family transcriptional regulator [Bacteroidota bacterium]
MDSSKIAIKTSRGIEFLRMEDILCCTARGRYTKILTISGKEFMLTRVLKEIESSLPGKDFFRTHKSYLINLNHITHYHNNNETPITLVNGLKIQLAKRRKQDFQKKINELVQTI